MIVNQEYPETPELEEAYRTAHRALEGVLPADFVVAPESALSVYELLSQFGHVIAAAERVVVGQLGAEVVWEVGQPLEDVAWEPVLAGVDFDQASGDFGPEVLLPEEWLSSPLEQAGRAYKRECGWDFPPDDSGMWLLMLVPTSAFGGEDRSTFTGRMVGFVLLHDRDKDGEYESIAHVWTAAAWRRRGVAEALLNEAHGRFSLKQIEGPTTDKGRALINAVAATKALVK